MQVLYLLLFCFFISNVLALKKQKAQVKIPLYRHSIKHTSLKTKRSVKSESLDQNEKLLGNTNANHYITAKITLGTPAQNFNVLLSTGTSKLWVLDKYSFGNAKASFPDQHFYDVEKSTTKTLLKDVVFNHKDGKYNVTGYYMTDSWTFESFEIEDQGFGLIQRFQNDEEFPFDGILGINRYSRDSNIKNEPFDPMTSIIRKYGRQDINLRGYTFFMSKMNNRDLNGELIGQMSFGFDSEHCDDRPTKWNFTLKESKFITHNILTIKNMCFGECLKIPSLGYFDTLSPSILLPYSMLKVVYDKIKPEYSWELGVYTVLCQETYQIVDAFGVNVDSMDDDYFFIRKESYIVDMGNDFCAINFELNDTPERNVVVFGAPAYREYCIHHDVAENTVQFYKPLPPPKPKKKEHNNQPQKDPLPQKAQTTTQPSLSQNNDPSSQTKGSAASNQDPHSPIKAVNNSASNHANLCYLFAFLFALYFQL